MENKFNYFDCNGNVVMVDVLEKNIILRIVIVSGKIFVNENVMEVILN